MSLNTAGERLPEMIGHTIVKALYCEPGPGCTHPAQMIFEFEDGSAFEIYGAWLKPTGLLAPDKERLDREFNNAVTNRMVAILTDGKGEKTSDYQSLYKK
jgi:hypothetical protein